MHTRSRHSVSDRFLYHRGHIAELVPAEDYGRNRDAGRQARVLPPKKLLGANFDNLEEGDEVRFAEEQGAQGTQASTVRVISKHQRRLDARQLDDSSR